MAEDIKNITMSMSDLREMMKGTYSASDELRSAFDKMVKAGKTLEAAVKANSKDIAVFKKELENAKNELRATAKATEDANKVLKESQKQWEMSTKGAKKYWEGLKGIGGGLSSVASGITKYTTLLGAQSISLANMRKLTLEYNKSIFQFSRTQQVAGAGMSDFGKALQDVRKNTVLSDNQFVDMADSVSKLFVGIKPTSTEMANMAKMLQAQFGPNVDLIKGKFEELAGVQSKFPSLYTKIKEGMELVAKAKAGDKEAKNRLELLKATVVTQMQLTGASQQQQESALQMLTETTGAQDDYNKLQKSQADLTKKSENAVLHAGQAMEGAMIKASEAAGKLYDWLDKIAPAAGTAAVAFAALDVAMSFGPAIKGIKNMINLFGTGKAAAEKLAGSVTGIGGAAEGAVGSVGKIGGALKGIGSAAAIAGAAFAGWELGKYLDEVLGISGAIGRMAGKKVNIGFMAGTGEEDIQKAAKKYGDSFTKKFKELGGEQAKGIQRFQLYQKTLKEMRKETEKIGDEQKKSNKAVETLGMDYNKIIAELNVQLGIIGQINQALNEQIGISESFGLVNKRAWDGAISGAEAALNKTKDATAEMIKDVQGKLAPLKKSLGIDLEVDKNLPPLEQMAQLEDRLSKARKAGIKDSLVLTQVNGVLNQIEQQRTAEEKAGAAVINARRSANEAEMKQMEQITSLTEQRLNTERQLMESAQFGLGASVEMMQKQVDLAHKMAQEYEKIDKIEGERVATAAKITPEQLNQLKNAKTAGEAQDYITNVLGKQGDEAKNLMGYYGKHQEYTTKMMQQQQKIYDLTKSIREGYLDAMREMSVGAGEFEKIIGTQEMGVTQLMGAVKETTGEFKTNTFKLGGMQTAGATAAGVGTQVTGQMTTGGLKFIGGAEQESRNQRIYQYRASVSNVPGIQGGTVSGVAPRVGTAVQPQFQEVYSGALREPGQQIRGPGLISPVASAQNVINVGVGQQAFNVGEAQRIQGGVPAGQLGAGILKAQPPPIPATGGFVPGIGTMPTPRQAGLEGPSQATVIIKLGPEIRGELDQVSNLKVQLDHAIR